MNDKSNCRMVGKRIPHLALCQDVHTLQCAQHENPHPSSNQLRTQCFHQRHTFFDYHNVPVYSSPIQIPNIYPVESLRLLRQLYVFITFTAKKYQKFSEKCIITLECKDDRYLNVLKAACYV